MDDLIIKSISQLSKVANNLIDKIASAIGWTFTHDTPERIAVNQYIEEIKNSDLPPLQKGAIISRAKRDIKEYAHQCKIVNGAVTYLLDTAKPEKMEDDWIAHFFDKTRLVSDEEFQIIWSRLLAEECNEPGSVPKSLLFILEKMSKEDAEDFLKLCAATITVFDEPTPLILVVNNEALSEIGLNFDKIIYLESIGLIKVSNEVLGPTYAMDESEFNNNRIVSYFDNKHELPEGMKLFPVGNVLFTKDGAALCKAASATEIEGFWTNTVTPWIKRQIDEFNKGK